MSTMIEKVSPLLSLQFVVCIHGNNVEGWNRGGGKSGKASGVGEK
jgi:hypothetical protein